MLNAVKHLKETLRFAQDISPVMLNAVKHLKETLRFAQGDEEETFRVTDGARSQHLVPRALGGTCKRWGNLSAKDFIQAIRAEAPTGG